MGSGHVKFGCRLARAVAAAGFLLAVHIGCASGQFPSSPLASVVANAAEATLQSTTGAAPPDPATAATPPPSTTAAAPPPSATAAAPLGACAKTDFEQVVEQAAGSLRELNAKNKPAFQEKLRALKDKRGWAHDVFLKEAAPFVRDDKIAEFDQSTDELLTAISTLGQEGATAAIPDCAVLLELRARMSLLVNTQTAKWTYMFAKIDTELWK